MKKILIMLLIFSISLLSSDKYYQKALDYLDGKIGLKVTKIKITDPKDCKESFECKEKLKESKKGFSITCKKIDYKNAIIYLQKSFQQGNIKAGKKILILFNLFPKLKEDKSLLNIFIHTQKKLKNIKFIKYFKKAKNEKDQTKKYIYYQKVLKKAPLTSIEYKIAKKRIEKIEQNYEHNFWKWIWFKIKTFFVSIFL